MQRLLTFDVLKAFFKQRTNKCKHFNYYLFAGKCLVYQVLARFPTPLDSLAIRLLNDNSSYVVMEGNHSERLGKQLRKFYSRSVLTDVILKVEDTSIPAHKVVLGAFSRYFEAMFSHGMKEASSNEVEFLDMDPKALKDIVDYMYSGSLEIDQQNAESLLSAASMLQMPEIVEKCCKKWKSLLDECNCIGIWLFADARGCSDLASVAFKHVLVSSNVY